MSNMHRMAVAACLIAGLIGCATLNDQKWYQDARAASGKAVAVAADSTSRAMKLTQHYLAEKDVLKTFQDAGEHSESAVLDILHRSGIAHGKGAAKGAGGGASGVASRNSPSGKGHGPAPTPIPIEYAGALRWPVEGGVV